jgi:hypothetical protein
MGTLVSSTNKTDRHDITEILLKVTLNKHSNGNRGDMADNFGFARYKI